MIVDFRSDTVTKPTKPMLEAMHNAPVGDDVFGEDPSINALEEFAASLFGMEKAIFCPSGTMTNQIAIKCHTQPGDEVIMPSYTFVSTANAFALRGASIVFVDSKPNHPALDEEKIEACITNKTKAIVVVHYAGNACNMDVVMQLASK